jgi:hypothetical protein
METESNKHLEIKKIITATKYLKKIITRLPKETLKDEEKKRLFVQYEALIDVIIDHCK